MTSQRPTMSSNGETIISSPGKVLIAGGYLVLDPAYPGLVISTTSRFYTVVRSAQRPSRGDGGYSFRIISPQFLGARWDYMCTISSENSLGLEQTSESHNASHSGPNPFLSLSLLYALKLTLEIKGAATFKESLGSNGLDIFVLADNDFYSQRSGAGQAPSSSELKSLPPFHSQGKSIKDVHKTGLGSSAAMTTSLVGALLAHFSAVSMPSTSLESIAPESLALIHNTSQLAHCAAQGKVGSGFDVSAAVWGSHLFRRFDKAAIQSVLDRGDSVGVEKSSDKKLPSSGSLLSHLKISNPLWHPSPLSSGQHGETHPTAVEGLAASSSTSGFTRPAPLELPPNVEIVLADVDFGSSTPSLVGRVMEWKSRKPEWAKQLYKILGSANQTLADSLLALRLAHAQDPNAYMEAVGAASARKSKDWDALSNEQPSAILMLLIEARNAMRSIQGGMRELGRQAGAPVEPNEMGDLIKASIDGAEGVIGGGVPGAGGYDALHLLYLNPSPSVAGDQVPTARQKVEELWSTWPHLSVGPLLSTAGAAAGVSSVSIQAQTATLAQAQAQSQTSEEPVKLESMARDLEGGLKMHSIGDVRGLREALSGSETLG